MTRPISSIPYWGVTNRRAAQPASQKLVRSSITNIASIGVNQPRWTTRRRFSAREKPSSTFARLSPRMIANNENAKLNASMRGAPPRGLVAEKPVLQHPFLWRKLGDELACPLRAFAPSQANPRPGRRQAADRRDQAEEAPALAQGRGWWRTSPAWSPQKNRANKRPRNRAGNLASFESLYRFHCGHVMVWIRGGGL